MTNLPQAEFTKIKDELDAKDWPDSRAKIITKIDGDLADLLRQHHGKEGEVLLIEDGDECGYSEFTPEWDWHCELRIGNNKVWTSSYSSTPCDLVDDECRFNSVCGLVKHFQHVATTTLK